MSNHDLCSTGLALGLGFSHAPALNEEGPKNPCPISSDPVVTVPVAASSGQFLTLHLSEASYEASKGCDEYSGDLYSQEASPHSIVSSFSNSVKRERVAAGNEELLEVEKVCSRASDEDEDGSNARKKLRLSKQQSALLEQNFKHHSTLNPKQKQALAQELNLRPRQVEVWFQNRRARTKLKQIEVDCEFLRKCCESLTDENKRLQREVQQLKAMKVGPARHQPFYMQLPAAVSNLTVCPSCERIGGGGPGESWPAKSPFIAMAPTAHLFNPFANSSAAC